MTGRSVSADHGGCVPVSYGVRESHHLGFFHTLPACGAGMSGRRFRIRGLRCLTAFAQPSMPTPRDRTPASAGHNPEPLSHSRPTVLREQGQLNHVGVTRCSSMCVRGSSDPDRVRTVSHTP